MNNKCVFIGFDPSFNHAGLSIIDPIFKVIHMQEVGVEINKKSTTSIFNAIPEVNTSLLSTTYKYIICGYKVFGIEVSRSISAWMATELYALDYDLFQRVKTSGAVQKINLYSNASLSKSLLGHKSSEKEKTIYLIENKILPIFKKHNYSIIKHSMTKTKFEKNEKGRWTYKDTITDGCADSMIYALRQFILYSEDEQLKQDILEVLPGLSNMKEME